MYAHYVVHRLYYHVDRESGLDHLQLRECLDIILRLFPASNPIRTSKLDRRMHECVCVCCSINELLHANVFETGSGGMCGGWAQL